ncbi:helix-turn-helix transcriptional regulator [Antrihabitans stalactiti]|uniref:Helix-turn-helix transcriptional regulator n=1 Tax=Antrihabitans stalactiti TaxID=2584121 RepID=A0A848KCL2_9NOCA|nr:helix-turn-helix transcriptional regulator [Antrihabitans stalactiti]NMN95446.1 helix-turn-helix transcriptional regulator [Antrihabitans stalactiti]
MTPSGLQPFTLGMEEVLAATGRGELEAAEKSCVRYESLSAGEVDSHALVDAMWGKTYLYAGRLDEACARLRSAVSGTLPEPWLLLAAAWWAQAEVARGRIDQARIALNRCGRSQHHEVEFARAWVLVGSGKPVPAIKRVLEVASLASVDGSAAAVEVAARYLALRFGDRTQARRIIIAAAKVDGQLAATCGSHAACLERNDGDGLDAVSSRFESMGATLLAAEASAHAAVAHARRGKRSKELVASSRAQRLVVQCCADARTPAIESIVQPVQLTARESDIAALVADGLSNRQIAERLAISLRTVEGHIYRIYSKLAIDHRNDLVRLIRARS